MELREELVERIDMIGVVEIGYDGWLQDDGDEAREGGKRWGELHRAGSGKVNCRRPRKRARVSK